MLLAVLLATAGCRRQPNAASALSELEQTLQTNPPAAHSPSPETPGPAPAEERESGQAYVNRAIEAVRRNEPAEGVMLLQSAQQSTTLNAQERMAIQRTIRAVTADLVERAARGDRQAQAELKRIERFLSVR